MPELPRSAIVDAAVASHRSWSRFRARRTGGSTFERSGGQISLLRHGDDHGDEIEVLFAEPADDEVGALVDEIEHMIEPPPGEPSLVRGVGWWSVTDDRDATLGPKMLARGFQWGWAPHWMGRELSSGRLAERFPLPDGVRLVTSADGRGVEVDWNVADLPYHDRRRARRADPLAALEPGTVKLAAVDQPDGSGVGKAVGQIVVHVADDDPGNAGIYSCGVVPNQRGRGIGAALTAAAADRATDLGCRVLTLNATLMGEPVYRRVGLTSGGWGRTWWLTPRQLVAPPPSAALVDLVEAIGFGDLAALDASLRSLESSAGGVDLEAPLRCALTPIGVAVQFGRAEAAQRLVDHGAELDVISAWDLGWRDRVPALLRDHPDRVDRRSGEMGATPVQVAIDRDDQDLFDVLLAAGADLTIRDLRFDSDALGWAVHLDRPHLADRIRSR